MSIEISMYKMIKKSSNRPIFFFDMDHTILVRNSDFKLLDSKINDSIRVLESWDKKMQKEDLSDSDMNIYLDTESLVEGYIENEGCSFKLNGLRYMARREFCHLIDRLSEVGDVYILTASDISGALSYFEDLKSKEAFKFSFLNIKGVLSSIISRHKDKERFSEEDESFLGEGYVGRPYILFDDKSASAVASKHALMMNYENLDQYHVQVPKFTENINVNVDEMYSSAIKSLGEQKQSI